MVKHNKRFSRSPAIREYRKIFNLFMEGQKTEPLYFSILKQQCNQISVILHTSTTRTDPRQVLARAKRHISKNGLGKNEEVWLVIDVDNRKKNNFDKLFEWRDENKNHGIAISNPCIEYWLLLHYENGDGIQNLNECRERLKRYLPHSERKNLGIQKIDSRLFETAIANAKKKHSQCKDWHTDNHSTVYVLVEKILMEEHKVKILSVSK